MPAWLIQILETSIPTLLQILLSGLQQHPAAGTPEVKAKIDAHQLALKVLTQKGPPV